ncbi:hypothetical protein EV421DRAFT_1902191 [Armillaria borealis]|uniref:Uncharacterized protein n=1 Tax=Armillaria borealis TaxID=47425 RepID=A0AA39JN58_9AGAR|nr:hypothetical protein EV421DRAFT_1902191 [Armillaria borealis]
MSAHIPIRLQCLPPCDCAEFYSDGSSLRGPTQLQHLKYDSCGHPWFSHLVLDILETDALYPHRRRGLLESRCQGFVPNLRATLLTNHWNPHTLCVCGGEWKAHMSYHASVSPPVPSASPILSVAPTVLPAAPPPLAPTDTVPPLPTARAITAVAEHAAEHVARLPPPIQAIRSLAVMDTTDMNALRMDAAQRTLPQHQTASQMVPPSANAKGKHKARPASINPQKSRIEVDIMIAPNVQVHSELHRAVQVGRLEVPGLDEFVANKEEVVYNSSYPWVWLAPQHRGNTYSFQPAGSLSGAIITPSALVNMTRMFQPLPASQENRFFLIVAPCFGNIKGSIRYLVKPGEDIVDQDEPHACFCYRVLHAAGTGFYRKAGRSKDAPPAWPQKAEPLDSSDDEHGGALPNAPTGHPSPRFPSWSPPPVKVTLAAGPRTPTWRHSTPNGHERMSREPSPMPMGHDAHRMVIFNWQRACYLAVDRRYTNLGYRIAGNTVEDIAEVLWSWFQHTVKRLLASFDLRPFPSIQQFSLSDGGFHILQLFEEQTYMEGSHRGGPALGPGPKRSCLLATLQLMVQGKHYWKQRGDGTYTFILGSTRMPIDSRTQYFTTSGRLLALSLLQLGQGFVVSPWVMLALIGGLDAFGQLTLDEIWAFSESDANMVACWYQVDRRTRIDDRCPQCAAIQGLFAEALSVELADFADPRNEMSHHALTAHLNARMLLDDDVYWAHPDLVALRRGFDWEIAPGSTGALANKFIDMSRLWFMHLFL